MIALDTNILARFYVDDPNDPEAAKQRPIAREIMTASPSLFVPLTVVLELEWVLRAFYRCEPQQIVRVFEHLLGLGHVNTEASERITAALSLTEQGMDFADALHLAGSDHCEALCTFDDRRFARRARRLGCTPPVRVPTQATGTAQTRSEPNQQ
ncbi:type II toxin-antitoxin system VapC family toxin [Thiorhodococcus minor]|uniref:Type II toxin-antitoxin system VapC family toxin n=1 Tax=Thiorhodococcus minor TaxID=57489 RepID=A0A6M0K4T4_9GAMM|nr:type II toxin-antitoxin system VapC family toxin [Thiorhodococcus minor]NEV64772.1 type II toxin-antitoxin system VapC family toxin [Thiorhodococcus minor]